MPVTLHDDSSNKASQKPGSPDPSLFTSAIETADGKTIWRSIPQPDRISFATLLTEEHFGCGGKKPVHDLALVSDLAEGLTGAVNTLTEKAVYKGQDGIPKAFTIPFGPREAKAFITLQRTKVKDLPAHCWYLRMEFCPRKLMVAGHEALWNMLQYAGPSPFDAGAVLRDAKLSRLDVAIDLFSVRPTDVLATATAAGKRMEIFGADGMLESLYLFGPKKTPKAELKTAPRKPFGALLLRLYDRNRQRAAQGKPPPYTKGTVTRLEASITRFPNAPYLGELATLTNPFSRARVSLASDVLRGIHPAWQRYWAATRAYGPDVSIAVTGLSKADHAKFEVAISKNPSTMLPHKEAWSEWDAGIEHSGLKLLVDAAKAAK